MQAAPSASFRDILRPQLPLLVIMSAKPSHSQAFTCSPYVTSRPTATGNRCRSAVRACDLGRAWYHKANDVTGRVAARRAPEGEGLPEGDKGGFE